MKAWTTTLAVVLVTLCQIEFASALGNSDNGPGCGLGKLAWSDYAGQKQIAPQVFMATTNGTFGSQTFGISSGTSGCTNDGLIMKNKHINLTTGAFDSLKQEMAQGQGEHLASLATLLGVPTEEQPLFFSMIQEKYTSLVPSENASPVVVLQAIQEAMEGHPVLAKADMSR
ncbi:DUF3015 domain-containing protein [Petrachloros mirabilis]